MEKAKPGSPASARRVLGLVIMYAVCSSSLSIVNKWAIMAVPFPSIVTACQFFTTAFSVFALGKVGALEVEPLQRDKLVRMAPINVVFYLAIFTNGKVLQYSNVETFIAFRSLTPLLVSGLDTVVRGEPVPSWRTMLALCAIAAGAGSYAFDDANFSARGYAWACVYLVIIVTEMVYAKHITATINLSTWGLVLYQNTIALVLFPIASALTGEIRDVFALLGLTGGPPTTRDGRPVDVDAFALVPLLTSCLLGVGISFAGWGARSSISATQFTVLGVACKLATVAINLVVWHHHAPLHAQISIVMCIVASVLYQQSAKRDKELHKLAAKERFKSGGGSSKLLDDGPAGAGSSPVDGAPLLGGGASPPGALPGAGANGTP
mmetsp:Transcript_2545/g.9765  ORF Transcript_2545/g.9765 Transcript_2545/m.9765 type:complete len:379 (-) Transcript_2545:490-1626(-)